MWNRVDPSRHEMVPRYKHAIKHEMRLVLLAKLLLSELRVLITEYYWCKFAVPWSTWRAETCQDNPNLVTQFLAGYTDGNPDAKDCRLTLWAIFVVHRLTGASVKRETLSPLLTQHKHRSHRNFHIILYRSVWEIWMSPHFLVMDSEWDTATSAMFATTSRHDCRFAALCDLFAFLPTSCIGEWLPKDAKSRCLFKYDFTCRACELQDSWLQSQTLDHRRRSGSSSAKMYGSTECLGVLVV